MCEAAEKYAEKSKWEDYRMQQPHLHKKGRTNCLRSHLMNWGNVHGKYIKHQSCFYNRRYTQDS
jgi:hypothetical protein